MKVEGLWQASWFPCQTGPNTNQAKRFLDAIDSQEVGTWSYNRIISTKLA